MIKKYVVNGEQKDIRTIKIAVYNKNESIENNHKDNKKVLTIQQKEYKI